MYTQKELIKMNTSRLTKIWFEFGFARPNSWWNKRKENYLERINKILVDRMRRKY